MNKIFATLQKLAYGRFIAILIILTMAIFLRMLFNTIPRVESFASGMTLFDLSPAGYSFEYALVLLDALGEAGRNAYLFQQLPVDFIYPGLFALTYTLLLTWLFARILKPGSKFFVLALIPVFAGVFDYLENISIILLITSYPNLSQILVKTASTFTILKSAFTTIFYGLLLIGIIGIVARKIKFLSVSKLEQRIKI